eukprot:jgi/Mesvir1/24646/Mv21952-RA.1
MVTDAKISRRQAYSKTNAGEEKAGFSDGPRLPGFLGGIGMMGLVFIINSVLVLFVIIVSIIRVHTGHGVKGHHDIRKSIIPSKAFLLAQNQTLSARFATTGTRTELAPHLISDVADSLDDAELAFDEREDDSFEKTQSLSNLDAQIQQPGDAAMAGQVVADAATNMTSSAQNAGAVASKETAISPSTLPVCQRNDALKSGGPCRCPVLYAEPRCENVIKEGPYLPTVFRGDFLLSQASLAAAKSAYGAPMIKIHLPGKVPPQRTLWTMKKGSKRAMFPNNLLPTLLPKSDPMSSIAHTTCAVVGNSGILLTGSKGPEIDAHDLIIRFNGAPTKGLEGQVGSRTDIRIVNSNWLDFRESAREMVLTHMRGPGALESYIFRMTQKAHKSDKFYLLSPEFVTYLGGMAFNMSKAIERDHPEVEGFQGGDYTPTGGWTGIMLAMHICGKVDLYGFHVGEKHGMPYHYHNRCIQPFAARDDAEWLLVKMYVDQGLAEFREECVTECHLDKETCDSCKAKNVSPQALEQAKRIWRKLPMPDYCMEKLRKLREANVAAGLDPNHNLPVASWEA